MCHPSAVSVCSKLAHLCMLLSLRALCTNQNILVDITMYHAKPNYVVTWKRPLCAKNNTVMLLSFSGIWKHNLYKTNTFKSWYHYVPTNTIYVMCHYVQKLTYLCVFPQLYLKEHYSVLITNTFMLLSLSYVWKETIYQTSTFKSLQLVFRPGIEPGPQWPEANALTTTL